MAGGGGNADGDQGFQIAPMIDLILVLLVFFMATVAIREVENGLGIALPGKSLATTQAAQVDMNISIDVDGSVSLNNEPVGNADDVALEMLQQKLKDQVELFDDKIPVIISPHQDVLHSRVIEVLNSCMAARVKNVTFGG
jgi:biopolymer transport protein ExbD